ncbi:MAG TPA: S9 family peptidase [Chitinophagaceae bacterium]|jgi:dipeptidyl aminopeptidase/acylaminoacyl peptidase|nr:S9 family peptidase [Chitinophagaceae bacterium]
MNKTIVPVFLLIAPLFALAQNTMTPALLWKLGRVTGLGISKDGRYVVYSVSTPDWETNKSKKKSYLLPINGGTAIEVNNPDSLLNNKNLSSDGKYLLSNKEVKVKKISGSDYYPELSKSNAYIFDNLNNRHWDEWEDGKFNHVFVTPVGKPEEEKDIMPDEPYDSPQKPFGGDEDYVWNPDGKHVVYVTKKKYGKDYAVSTNTDLYEYDVTTGTTKNLTEGRMGYDVNPSFSKSGTLAWLSMKRDSYEADKQDIVASTGLGTVNLTKHRDDIHVTGFRWSDDGRKIFFWAPINGTLQLFEVDYTGATMKLPDIRQITNGDFDIGGIVGQSGNVLIVSRADMNHAAELYAVDIGNGNMKQLTYVNDSIYRSIGMCKTERRLINTADGKKMLTWVIYPPNFDPNKKYPTLLYCQGGPQASLTQFYSFRWNFQLMASQGYIVVAPNRRGMPGHGTKWNEQVSKDWGGQVMKDYLSAIDAVSKEKYVDKDRLGCVGASYGGYSVFMLAGIHNNRFKTFFAHDGVFDLKSWYGTTEEMWFANWDMGGPYWDKNNAQAQKTYSQFSPSNFVDKWNTPIMIVQGGKDYRVPIEQGMQAFQAAQLRGIKSKLLYLPEENHWVLTAQNALVWQHEFFKWLDETLPPAGKKAADDKKAF